MRRESKNNEESNKDLRADWELPKAAVTDESLVEKERVDIESEIQRQNMNERVIIRRFICIVFVIWLLIFVFIIILNSAGVIKLSRSAWIALGAVTTLFTGGFGYIMKYLFQTKK